MTLLFPSDEKGCKKLFWTFSWLASGVHEWRWSDLTSPLVRPSMNAHTRLMLLVLKAALHFPSPAWAVRPFLAHQDEDAWMNTNMTACVTQGAARRPGFVQQNMLQDRKFEFWYFIIICLNLPFFLCGIFSVNTTLFSSLLWWPQRFRGRNYSRYECFNAPCWSVLLTYRQLPENKFFPFWCR